MSMSLTLSDKKWLVKYALEIVWAIGHIVHGKQFQGDRDKVRSSFEDLLWHSE
jgi:hypothetical protein